MPRCQATAQKRAVRGQMVGPDGKVYLRGQPAPKESKPLMVAVKCTLKLDHGGAHYNGEWEFPED